MPDPYPPPSTPENLTEGTDTQAQPQAASEPGRIRTILHLFVFAVLFVIGVVIVGTIAFLVPNILLVSSLAIFLSSLVATAIVLRMFHQRPLVSVGLHWDGAAARHLALGLGLGAVFAAAVTLIPVLMGKARWVEAGAPFAPEALILFLVLILFSAIGEEVLYRGFPLQRMLETFGVWPAVLITSALFAWSHSGNHAVGWMALTNTFLWGVVFAVGYLSSRDLWLPIGLHVGWNWALPLLGVELSGFTLGVVGHRLQGSDPFWDGGDYGPEAGILTTIAAPLILVILWRTRTRTSV